MNEVTICSSISINSQSSPGNFCAENSSHDGKGSQVMGAVFSGSLFGQSATVPFPTPGGKLQLGRLRAGLGQAKPGGGREPSMHFFCKWSPDWTILEAKRTLRMFHDEPGWDWGCGDQRESLASAKFQDRWQTMTCDSSMEKKLNIVPFELVRHDIRCLFAVSRGAEQLRVPGREWNWASFGSPCLCSSDSGFLSGHPTSLSRHFPYWPIPSIFLFLF